MNVLIIDTETANSIEQPICYDKGYFIVDLDTFEILRAHSFAVAEVLLDKDLIKGAYYANKIPNYWNEIKSGDRELKGIWNIWKTIQADMKEFNVKDVYAYNMNFDKRSSNNTIRYLTGSAIRWFFPYGTEFHCIWHMACSSILRSKWFIKWALENGFVSEKGNIQTSAEVAYRYIIKDPDFEEMHEGLADVSIETAILFKILKSRMKYEDKPYSACWRIPQKRREELGL